MLTLLLIEDDEAKGTLRALLHRREHKVVEARDLAEAREWIRDATPELAVVDEAIGGGGAAGLPGELAEIPEVERPFVLLLTRGEVADALEAALESDADDYLLLPVRAEVANARLAVAERRIGERAELRRTEERLFHDAFHDAVTDLRNRPYFMAQLEHAVARGERHPDELFAVLLLDLDRFKLVNDSLGHDAGDELLLEASRRIARCTRTVDTVARLGSDEFAVLLDEIADTSDAVRVAERIQEALTRPFDLGDEEVFTSAGIGIAQSASGYGSAADLLRDANAAMHFAKAEGRGELRMFDPEMHRAAIRRLRLEGEVRRAVEREEFVIHYQPIVSMESGRPTGFEALARWRHPERGLLLPLEFIPIAEETGLILELGDWVIRQACRRLRGWQDDHPGAAPVTLGVNLSGRQFAQPDLIDRVHRLIDDGGVDPGTLHLEVTESALMENFQRTVEALGALSEVNFQLHIDDFGTGYSSLSYLHRLPVDSLKIDHSFVEGLAGDEENREIVRAVISLAHTLGMEVVAEGVETEAQAEVLAELGCDYAQGHHFAEPLDPHAVEAFLGEAASSPGVDDEAE